MEQPQKKIKRECNHRWSDSETLCLLSAIAERTKANPEGFEKPTAQKFYFMICEKEAGLKNIAALGCSVIKNKMRYLKKTFINAQEWKGSTGAGLLEEGRERSVKEYIEKICPYYNVLEEIFGQRKSVVPPYHFDSYADAAFEANDDIIFEFDESQESLVECIEDNTNNTHVVCDTVEPQVTENVKKKLKLTPTEKKSNSALEFLIKSQEKRNDVEQLKLALQEKLEERRLNLQERTDQKKLELEREKLDFEKEKYRNEFELKKLQMQQEMELKKFELELKYKKH